MKEYSKGIYVKFKPEEVEIMHNRMKEAGVQNMSAYIRKMALNGILILTHTDFSYLQVLNSKNQNLIRLIITILILIISILSGSEETSLWMGYDGFQ